MKGLFFEPPILENIQEEKIKNSDKIILDLCGGSGSWSKPYKEKGYDVRIITLPEQDVRTYKPPQNVYGILAAPPCTMFSFARSNAKKERDLKEGMEIVEACLKIIWECSYIQKRNKFKTILNFWCLENPNGFLKYFLGRPVMIFDPWEFGDFYTKETYLWGWFNIPFKTYLSIKTATKINQKKMESISNITFKLKDRQTVRSITPSKFANKFFEVNR